MCFLMEEPTSSCEVVFQERKKGRKGERKKDQSIGSTPICRKYTGLRNMLNDALKMQSVKSKLSETTRQRNFFSNSYITSSITTKVGEKRKWMRTYVSKKNLRNYKPFATHALDAEPKNTTKNFLKDNQKI